jgi:GcrA cell cycle regulator
MLLRAWAGIFCAHFQEANVHRERREYHRDRWTPERIEALRAGCEARKSAAQIARELGHVSRNAVIGKAARMGFQLKAPRNPYGMRSTPDTQPKPRAPARRLSALTGLYAHLSGNGKAQPLLEAPTTDIATVSSILDLKANDCRWPIGDPREPGFGFCGGAKAPGLPYCEHHARQAYEQPISATAKATAKAA